MLDLIDLTCPTPKDSLGEKDRILSTDGDNVYLLNPEAVNKSGEDIEMYEEGDEIVISRQEGDYREPVKIPLSDALTEFYGMIAQISGRRTKFSLMGIDADVIKAACENRDYSGLNIAFDEISNVDTAVTLSLFNRAGGISLDNDRENLHFFAEYGNGEVEIYEYPVGATPVDADFGIANLNIAKEGNELTFDVVSFDPLVDRVLIVVRYYPGAFYSVQEKSVTIDLK